MSLKKAKHSASVTTHQEHIKVRHLMYAIEDLFSAHDAEVSPSVALRVEDVAASWIVAGRLEMALPRPTGGDAVEPAPPPVALLNHIGKARERLRKAIKELEDHCPKAGTPIAMGLAEEVAPLLKRAEGVMEEALARGPGNPDPPVVAWSPDHATLTTGGLARGPGNPDPLPASS